MPGDPAIGSSRQGLFATTHWSVVLRAQDRSETALGTLCEDYRQPLMIWLRCRRSAEDAEDLVQGFFAQMLSRNFLKTVASEKGRFRTLLLTCFKNYLMDCEAKARAAKRGGGQALASINATEESGQPSVDPAGPEPAPDLEYDRAWARNVLAHALVRLRAECARQGHMALCSELEPVLFYDDTAAPYAEIANRLGMTEGAIKTAAHRIRNRLKGIVRDEILQTVANEEDWEDEVRYLIKLFER